MMKFEAMVMAALVVATAGCSDRSGTGTTGGTAVGTASGQAREAGAGKNDTGVATEASAARDGRTLSAEDRRFVQEAASCGMFEVDSSKLARQRGVSGIHEDFAQRMIDDHQKANDELEAIAEKKGFEVPAAMAPKHQEQIDELRGLSGRELEQAYHDQQMAAHDEAIGLFEDASKNLDDADLKAFATKTLPTLRAHKQMMQGQHGPESTSPR